MQITRTTDYGIRVLTHLARLPAGTRLTAAELAAASHAPESLVAKLLQRLVAARLAASRRGFDGGFALARPPREVTVLDIVTALEGPLRLNVCVDPGSACEDGPTCAARGVWTRAQAALSAALSGTTLEELAAPAALTAGWPADRAAYGLRDNVLTGRTP